MFWELKTATGRVSHEQHAWIDGLVQAGADVYIVRPYEWDWIERTLKGVSDHVGT